MSPTDQLTELFDTLKGTHGGPAFITGPQLNKLRRKVLRREDELFNEEDWSHSSRCAWVMRQLEDPYAAYLSPSQVTTLRERFHGTVGVGIRMHEFRPCWWQRWWKQHLPSKTFKLRAVVTHVEVDSSAERAGVQVTHLAVSRICTGHASSICRLALNDEL